MTVTWDSEQPTVAAKQPMNVRWDDEPEPAPPKDPPIPFMPSHAPPTPEVDEHPLLRRGIQYGTATAATLGAGVFGTPGAAPVAFPLGMMAGKQIGDLVLGPEPAPLERTRQTEGFLPGVGEALSNVPINTEEVVRGATTFPLDLANRAGEIGALGATVEAGKGVVQMGKDLFSADKWVTQPVTNLTVGLGAKKGASMLRDKLPAKITAVERLDLRKVDPEASKIIEDPVSRRIEEGVRRVMPRKKSDVQTTDVLAREVKNDFAGITEAARLREEGIVLTRKGEEVRGQLPKTQGENLSYLGQAKARVADQIDKISSSGAMQDLRVPVDGAIRELRMITTEAGFGEARVAQAAELVKALEKVQAQGGYKVSAAVRQMTELNNDIKALMSGKNESGKAPQIYGIAANQLKNSLNAALATVEGGENFGQLRKTLGQLISLEQRAMRRLEQQVMKESTTSPTVYDYIATEQLIRAMARARPEGLLESVASYAVGKTIKILNSPDRATAKMWRAADRVNQTSGRTRTRFPEVPTPEPPTTYFDPAVGARTSINPGTVPRTDLGTSRGGAPTTYFDPAVGARTNVQQNYSRRVPPTKGSLPKLSKSEALDAFGRVRDELAKLDPTNPKNIDRIDQLSIMEQQYRQILEGKAQPADFAPKP